MGRDLNIVCLSPRDEKFVALRAEYQELHAKLPPEERGYHATSPDGKRCSELQTFFNYAAPHELDDDFVEEGHNSDATLDDMQVWETPKGYYRSSLPADCEYYLEYEDGPATGVDVSKLPPNCRLIITYS